MPPTLVESGGSCDHLKVAREWYVLPSELLVTHNL